MLDCVEWYRQGKVSPSSSPSDSIDEPYSIGKTAAFVIPCLEKINPKKDKIQALLLVPTRELALQTSQVCKNLGKHLGVQVMVTTGGTSLKDDIMRLHETVHVLVGTPGRVLDLAGKGVADFSDCPTFVMDEADKLLSPEFTVVIKQILTYLPKPRQIMLFSATFPLMVKDFKASNGLKVSARKSLPNDFIWPRRRMNIWSNLMRSTSWTNSLYAVSLNIMLSWKRNPKFIASIPSLARSVVDNFD